MPIKVKANSNGNLTNGKATVRKKKRLPTQKDIAKSLKNVEMTAEDEKLIDVSMRAVKALKKEQERAKRLEKRRNSLRGKRRLPTQKDIAEAYKDVPITPEEQELIDASMRVIKAMDELEAKGFVW